MKRLFAIISVLACLTIAHAQNPSDSCLITSVPYTQDFSNILNNNLFIPCWERLTNGSTNASQWVYITSVTYAGHITQALCLRTSTNNTYYSCIILPKLDSALFAAEGSPLMLHLRTAAQTPSHRLSFSTGTLSSTTSISSFIPLLQHIVPNTDIPHDLYIPITLQDVANRHLALIARGGGNNILIESISIEPTTPYGYVHDMQCTPGATGTLLSWSNTMPLSSSSYTVRLYPHFSSSTLPADTALIRTYTTTDTSLVLRGLTPFTSYRVAVTASPLPGSAQTQWGFLSFRTTGATDTCPFPTIFRTSATDTTIHAEWFPNADNMSWNISLKEHRGGHFGREIPIQFHYTDSSYTHTGLTPGSLYQLILRPNCSPNLSYPVNISTPCSATTPLPFTEDFQNLNTTCWFITNTSTSLAWTDYDGNRYGGLTDYCIYGLPYLDASISDLFISGKILSGSFIIGVIQNDNPDTFTPIDTIAATTSPNEWEPFTAYLTGYTGPEGRIALRPLPTLASTHAYIDDLTVDCITSTHAPIHLQARVTSTTTATLSWHDTNHTNLYQIEYGPHGFLHGQGNVLNVLADTATLAGLRHSTRYDAYVRIYSAGTYSEWSYPVTFTTHCGDIDRLPYATDFDDLEATNSTGRHFPPCWHHPFGSDNNCPVSLISNSGPLSDGSDGNSLRISVEGYRSYHIMLPRIPRSRIDLRGTQLTLDTWTINETEENLIVGVAKNTSTSPDFTPVDTLHITPYPTRHEIYFNTYSDTGEYIAFLIQDIRSNIYLDNIEVDYIPNCQSPHLLQLTHTDTTHVRLAWQPRGGASRWQIAFGPEGFDPDTNTSGGAPSTATPGHSGITTVTGSTCTLSGLHPATTYDIYIRSLCTADTNTTGGAPSHWSVQPLQVHTLQSPATIPYLCDFEDSTETHRWQTASNLPYTWHHTSDATSNHCYQFQTIDGGLGCYEQHTVNAVLYRDIRFTPDTNTTGGAPSPDYINSITITFKSKTSNLQHLTSPHIEVYLIPPTLPMHPSDNTHTLPWTLPDGNTTTLPAARLHPIATLSPHTDWATDTIQFDTLMGIQRIVFFLSATTDGYFTDAPLSIDDINIFPTPCPTPFDLQATNITDTSALVTWYGDPTAGHLFTLTQGSSDTILTDTLYTNHINLQNLSSFTTYTARVCRLCTGGQFSASQPLSFTTILCNGGQSDTIGCYPASANVHSDKLPVTRSQIESYTQQIFPADSISRAGTIRAINLRLGPGAINSDRNQSIIYLGHTTTDRFLNNRAFIDPSTLQMVYSGSLPTEEGWNKIVLHTPFEYDGVSNLVMAVLNSRNSSKPNYYYCENTIPFTSIVLSGSEEINPTSIEALRSSSNSRQQLHLRNQAAFDFCSQTPCPLPKLKKPNLRYSRVTLRWQSTGADMYEVHYRLFFQTDWDTLLTSNTSLTINDVFPNYRYTYRVRGICPHDRTPMWSYGTFRTSPDDCPFPEGFHIENADAESISFRWTPDDNNTQYRLHIYNTHLDTVIYSYLAHCTVTNLEHATTYFATVSANCSIEDHFGDPTDPIQFTTSVCPDVTDLTLLDLQGNSAVIDWNSPEQASQWEIQYGYTGFDQGSGTSVITDRHPYTITVPDNIADYQAYVRAICGTNFVSEHWAGPLTLSQTAIRDNPDASAAHFTLVPNPATHRVDLLFGSDVPTSCALTLRDAHGRIVATASGTVLHLHGLPSGVYFVTLTTPDTTATRKLIIQQP